MWVSCNFRYGEEDVQIAFGILQSPGIIAKNVEMDYLSIHIIYSDVNVFYCPSALLY